MNKILENYNNSKIEIIKNFIKKQGFKNIIFEKLENNLCKNHYEFEGTYFFTFDEILLDILTNQKKGKIIEYYYYIQDNLLKSKINYQSYIKGFRHEK